MGVSGRPAMAGVRRHARFEFAGELPLALLVLGFFLADDHHHAVAADHFATVAAWLHRRSHLHLETPHLEMTPCLAPVGVPDAAPIRHGIRTVYHELQANDEPRRQQCSYYPLSASYPPAISANTGHRQRACTD